MVSKLVNLELAAHDDTDFKVRLTPRHTIYYRNSQRSDLQRHAAIYNLLEGGNTVRYTDMDKFDAINIHVSLPIKPSQVKRSL